MKTVLLSAAFGALVTLCYIFLAAAMLSGQSPTPTATPTPTTAAPKYQPGSGKEPVKQGWALGTPEKYDPQNKPISDPNTIEVNFLGSDGSKWKATGWKKVK